MNFDPRVDMEVRAHEDHHASLRLWLRLLSCSTRIEDTIRQRLREQFGITLPRFDLLSQLERHPEGLRMNALSRRMMVTGGNVTGMSLHVDGQKIAGKRLELLREIAPQVNHIAAPFDPRNPPEVIHFHELET